MFILFGLAAFYRILANPATLKNKSFLLVGLDSPSALGVAQNLCEVGAKVFVLREDAARCHDLQCSFPDAFRTLPGKDLPTELDSTLQDRTLKGVVFLSEKLVTGDVELMPSASISAMFEENVVKVVRIVKDLLPFLRESRGRIIFLGSTAGRLALPTTGLYSLTKFALEGLSDSLRRELRRFDVKVVTIERCLHVPMAQEEDLRAAMWSEANEDAHGTFGEQYIGKVARSLAKGGPARAVDVSTFTEAMAAENPKDRYLLCTEGRRLCDFKIEAICSQFLPATLMDLLVEWRHPDWLPPCLRVPPPHIK